MANEKKPSTALATITNAPATALTGLPVTPGMAFLMNTFDEVWRFAQVIAKSGMTPKGIDTPEQVTVQIMTGNELGLKPMVAVQNIIVINGKPAIPGDLALSIVMNSELLEDYDEEIIGVGDDRVAVVTIKRKAMREIKRKFSVKDAIQAGLWQTAATQKRTYWDKNTRRRVTTNEDVPNESPWFRYQERMLIMRARGFGLRDRFPDVLKGMHLQEEMHGVPEDSRDEMPMIAGPSAPEEEIEEADIVEHNATLAAQQAAQQPAQTQSTKPEPAMTVAASEQPAPAVQQAQAPAGPDAPDDEGDFDEQQWMLDVRVRFNEAKTAAEVDQVHEMFSDTLETMVGMEGRQEYEGHHTAAMTRTAAAPGSEVSGDPTDDRFPGDEFIKPTEPAASDEGAAFVAEFRKVLHHEVTTRQGVTDHFNGQGHALAALIADGDLHADWDAFLRKESTDRFRALPKPAAPAAGGSDLEVFDREFREKLEVLQTIDEVNAYSTETLERRNTFGKDSEAWKAWRQAVVNRRNVINGIA